MVANITSNRKTVTVKYWRSSNSRSTLAERHGRKKMKLMNNFTTTLPAVNGGFDTCILCGKQDLKNYVEGKPVGDVPIAVKFTVALHGAKLAPLTVRIENYNRFSKILDEQISEACATQKFIMVRFADCIVKLYTTNGQIQMTASASDMEIVNSK